ncbi:MAG: hypothetical protein IKJ89_03580 [Kiritimatiellae bacterium]|nr:hypothetical protein [Kiritimatiellia bacterium]
MKKIVFFGIVASVVVALLAVLLRPSPVETKCNTCGMERSACLEGCTHDPCMCKKKPQEPDKPQGPDVWSTTQEKLTPEAVKRLREGPQLITVDITIEGNGERSGNGHRDSGHFLFKSTVIAQSTVRSKEPHASSVFTITEERKFLKAKESFNISNFDMAFALKTLPADEVEVVCGALCVIADCFWPGYGKAAGAVTAEIFQTLRSLDGASFKALIGPICPPTLEKLIDILAGEEAQREWEKAIGVLHSIEGRTFIIVYDQLPDQPVCNVEYRSEDGQPLSKDDKKILRRINIFLDAEVVPDSVKESEPGTEWTIGVSAIDTMFAGISDGTCSGRLTAHRDADTSEGDWQLSVKPGTIVWRAEGGRQNASLDIRNLDDNPTPEAPAGTAVIDGNHYYVRNLQLTATGKLDDERMSEYCFGLFPFSFTAKGECWFRSVYSTTPNPATETK